ncbi:Na+/melibiose symporter-like transporter [Weissella uvarum]|uniref:hypothetical protein n=1 Tax=Weissella uvarum TaxID=1479233 RepID=UPI00195F614F|nr:hypothetical protein [Weissella uvarum]MBM7617905.1 Na+/melibiose symporter-like transporter [Weissella uvarum]MCM0596098.1 hypothetical protein [Weissella uvarum]
MDLNFEDLIYALLQPMIIMWPIILYLVIYFAFFYPSRNILRKYDGAIESLENKKMGQGNLALDKKKQQLNTLRRNRKLVFYFVAIISAILAFVATFVIYNYVHTIWGI